MHNPESRRKNRRSIKIVAFVAGIPIALFMLLRLTGVLGFYKLSTTSMSPRYEPGDYLFSSCLKTPHKGDIVCYTIDSLHHGDVPGQLCPGQLIATEGDTLEIRRGLAYINDRLADDSMQLKFGWIRHDISAYNLSGISVYSETFPLGDTAVVSMLTEKEGMQLHLVRMVAKAGEGDPFVWKGKEKNWNRDWYGPLVIPKDFVFIMGMNRDNAFDSRYRGMIPKENIKSVAIN